MSDLPKTASPIVPVNYDILRQPRDQYMGKQPEFPDRDGMAHRSPEYDAWLDEVTPIFDEQRQRRREWDRTIRHAIATGRMSPEQAVELGFRPENHEGHGTYEEPKWGKWRPLPERLYHVTNNLPAIAAEGRLRSPWELDLGGKSRGLGSFGSDDSISLTDSLEEAQNIVRAMREGADVASGRLPIQRLVEMARTGEGAEKPWLQTMFGDNHDWSTGNPQGLDDLLLGREPCYEHKLPEDHPLRTDRGRAGMHLRTAEEWGQHGFYPYPSQEGMKHPDGPLYNRYQVYRNLTPQEQAHSAFEWWRNPWAAMRGWAGGPSDPLFASTDPDWYANLDPSHIGIVETQPVPGGHGYPMSSLGEWRIPTGEAVNITALNGQPYTPPSADYPLMRTARAIYKRWVFSPQTRRVLLADNNEGHPLDVRYHSDLARELNEPNLVHGYAVPIGNGWRLSDWENKPIEDQFTVAQVMRALTGAQASESPREPLWGPPVPEDWSRTHHGLPT